MSGIYITHVAPRCECGTNHSSLWTANQAYTGRRMAMTENHNYHTPKEGELDWHIPLNENFENLDRTVTVRDTEDARDSYEPYADALFVATDTGERFIGDGESWVPLPYPASSSSSPFAALSNGHALAYSGQAGAFRSANPSQFSDDSDTIQSLVDWIVSFGPLNAAGDIWLPATKPDGSRWDFPETVYIADTESGEPVHINIYGVGMVGEGPQIATSIDDGSPIFKFVGDTSSNATPSEGFVVEGLSFDNEGTDAVQLEFVNCSEFQVQQCTLTDFSGSGLVVDSGCYGFYLAPHIKTLNRSAVGIEFRHTDDTFPVLGNATVGEETVIQTPMDVAIRDNAGVYSMRISGEFEGASGNGLIDVQADGSQLLITPHTLLGYTTDGADAIHIGANAEIVAMPGEIAGCDGDAIHNASGETVQFLSVSPCIYMHGVGGQLLNLQAGDLDAANDLRNALGLSTYQ